MDARSSPGRILGSIWKIRSRTSWDIGLLPMGFLTLEISIQYQRKPARCQRTTVSGVTTKSGCFQPNQQRRTISQKSLPSNSSLGRLQCRTCNCRAGVVVYRPRPIQRSLRFCGR